MMSACINKKHLFLGTLYLQSKDILNRLNAHLCGTDENTVLKGDNFSLQPVKVVNPFVLNLILHTCTCLL